MKKIIILLIIFSVVTAAAQDWIQVAKSLPPPNTATSLPNHYYGYSVSVDGNYAVVGACRFNGYSGKAFVLIYDGSSWNTQAELTASDTDGFDWFGSSVCISGNNIVVGAYRNSDDGENSGSAYVFTKPLNGWENMTETAKLTASDATINDYFGLSVSVFDNYVVVGAYGDDNYGGNSGSAYIFKKPNSGWENMSQTAKIIASDGEANNMFGISVSISGNNIVVGASGNNGSAYVFTKPDTGWEYMSETAKLTASDTDDFDGFGISVSISGDDVVVGAYGDDDDNEENSGSAYIYTKPATGWENTTEIAKLTASDTDEFDRFGISVSISGDDVVVGAYEDDDNGENSGSAYIYTKPATGWENATETAKLTAADGEGNDMFGKSVSVSANRILVGAYHENENGYDSGATYAYTKSANGWITSFETEKKVPVQRVNTNENYGYSISVDGNYAVVGAHGVNDYTGEAYVLFYDGYNWIIQAKLIASDGLEYDKFGSSVSILGDNIVVGAYGDDDNGETSGSIYIFTKPVTGWVNMSEIAKLTAYDGMAGDCFGNSVIVSEDNIVVGAYGDDDNGENSGSVYVFTKPVTGWANMAETAKLTASDGMTDDYFGCSVNISEDNIVVGAYGDDGYSGSVYVFVKSVTGWEDMSETAKITALDAVSFDYFGMSVDISGNNIVVGASGHNGSAYVFLKPTTGWEDTNETTKLTASDGSLEDRFGKSVSISGDNIVVGAYGDGGYSGSVYVFVEPITGWEDMGETEKLTVFDSAEEDRLGFSVSISGDNIVVGAYGNDVYGFNSGSTYLFRNCLETSSVISATACDLYTSPSGKIWIVSNTYKDTILNANLCDSIITVNLTINHSALYTLDTNICKNSAYIFVDGTQHTNITESESYISVFPGQADNGCDSLYIENITVLPSIEVVVDGSILTSSNINGTYQWLNCIDNTPIFGATEQFYTAIETGYYSVQIIENSCIDTSECFYVAFVGVKEKSIFNEINIYPIPNKGIVNIQLGDLKDVSIQVLDIRGELLFNVKNINTSFYQFNLNEATGIYFIKITSNNKTQEIKLIKE